MKGNLIEAPSLASSSWGFRSRFEGREARQSIESPPSYLARSSIRWDGMGLLAGGDEHHWSPLSFLSLAVGPAGTSGIWRCGGRGPTVQWLLLSAADVSIDQSSTRYLVYIYYYYLKKERSNLVLLWYLVLLSIVIGAFWYINPKKHVERVSRDMFGQDVKL